MHWGVHYRLLRQMTECHYGTIYLMIPGPYRMERLIDGPYWILSYSKWTLIETMDFKLWILNCLY